MKSRFCALLVAAVFGCHAWTPVPKPTTDGSLPGTPETVRVTRTFNCGEKPTRDCVATRGTLVLHHPRIELDSLVGYHDAADRERVAIQIHDVVSIESRDVDPYRTVGLGLGIGAVIAIGAIIGLLVVLSSGDW